MISHRLHLCLLAGLFAARSATAAPPPPPTSLNTCQNAVKVATAAFIKNKVAAIGGCLQAVSTQIVKNNAPDADAAAGSCVTQFRKLNDSRGLNKQLSDKLATAIVTKCDPSYQTPGGSFPNTHTLADIIGSGAGVAQPLDAENLNAWCSHYGGDGSIDTLPEWIDCIATAAECDVDSAIASQYPRALEWLNLVKPSMQALAPPVADPTKVTDAVAGLDAVKAEIDGPDNDNIASIQCGGIVSSGTAVADNCLAGTTFSNGSAGGLTGTMANNGAVTLTPSTTDQTIALGYHNGSGKCVGDPDLVSGNIKSGTSIFGVTGTYAVLCGNGSIDGGESCDQNNLNGKTCVTQGLAGGTLQCAANCVFDTSGCYAARFVDNGNGTVTDNQTKLIWEQKDQQSGGIHDWGTTYTWGSTSPPYPPSGTAYTVFLATLNGGGGANTCFAGLCDWRLPSIEELHTIILGATSNPKTFSAFNTSCAANCTVDGAGGTTQCSCTQSGIYWSASTYALGPGGAWDLNFGNGVTLAGGKTIGYYVRAVRGGL